MEFRPCIDIHNGKVKQIVGGTLLDDNDYAKENFVSEQSAADYAEIYKSYRLKGGHVIMLNSHDSEFYEKTKEQALKALDSYPGGLDAGGGITAENAAQFIDAGAAHVIVTSYVFKDGNINLKNLDKIKSEVGKEHLVLDLSCRRKDNEYYVVTDRWQRFTDMKLNVRQINELASECDEFLIHAVDVEGKAKGIETELVKMLAQSYAVSTYAGGVGSYEDLELLKKLGKNKVNVTIGSALDLFGGKLKFKTIIEKYCKED